MTWEELKSLLAQWERSKLDVKRELLLDEGSRKDKERKRADLAFDVAAIANARGRDGYLVIGIDEDTKRPFPGGTVGLTMPHFSQIEEQHLFIVKLSGPIIEEETPSTKALTAGELNPRQLQAVEYLRMQKRITSSEYSRLLSISIATAKKDLSGLVKAGLIKAVGSTKGRYYQLTEGL